MAPVSMTPRSEQAVGASSTPSHRNGNRRMWLLTTSSRGYSCSRTTRLAVLPCPTSHIMAQANPRFSIERRRRAVGRWNRDGFHRLVLIRHRYHGVARAVPTGWILMVLVRVCRPAQREVSSRPPGTHLPRRISTRHVAASPFVHCNSPACACRRPLPQVRRVTRRSRRVLPVSSLGPSGPRVVGELLTHPDPIGGALNPAAKMSKIVF